MSKRYMVAVIFLMGFLLIAMLILTSCTKQNREGNNLPIPPAIDKDDFLIIPGKRAGTFQLGESIESLESRIGKGIIAPRENFQIYSFKDWMVDLCVQKDLIMMILVMNPKFATKEGIKIGSSVSPVVRTFGRKYEYQKVENGDIDYIIQYWDSGISFSIKNEQIMKLKVFDQKLTIKEIKD